MIVDFPLPVLPIIAVVSPGFAVNVMLVKKYVEEDYKEVFNYIKDNYLQKECKIRSLKVS